MLLIEYANKNIVFKQNDAITNLAILSRIAPYRVRRSLQPAAMSMEIEKCCC